MLSCIQHKITKRLWNFLNHSSFWNPLVIISTTKDRTIYIAFIRNPTSHLGFYNPKNHIWKLINFYLVYTSLSQLGHIKLKRNSSCKRKKWVYKELDSTNLSLALSLAIRHFFSFFFSWEEKNRIFGFWAYIYLGFLTFTTNKKEEKKENKIPFCLEKKKAACQKRDFINMQR